MKRIIRAAHCSLARITGIAGVLALALAANTAYAAPPQVGTLVETPLHSLANTPDVVTSLVSVYEPLPQAYGAHPEACDWISYVRYRDLNGPAASASADAIFAGQPGVGGGPNELDIMARNTVMSSAAVGRHVEFWTDNHRWNCLIDRTGLDAAIAAKDYHVAVDYYYNNKPVNGKVFPGFPTWGQQQFLTKVDQGQAMTDWYNLLAVSLPDPAVRARKLLCGGHSYGGVFTSVFAAWGFGSDPTNPANAGYQQCAAFFAVDSVATSDPAGLANIPFVGDLVGVIASVIDGGVHSVTDLGLFPTIDVGIEPLIMNYSIIGLAAYFEPNKETDLLKILPAHDLITNVVLRVFLARTYLQFLGIPTDVLNFRYTNEALLGAMFDDNLSPIALIQIGLGSLSGGPIGYKDFPLPSQANDIPIIGPFIADVLAPGPNTKVGPTDPNALYTWNDYKATPGTLSNGKSYTSPDHEVADIHEFARTLFEGPGTWIEGYLPINYVVGVGASLAEGAFQSPYDKNMLYPEGILSKPRGWVFGEDGGVYVALTYVDPFLQLINPGAPLVPIDSSYAPNYQHYDMSSGAYNQNNGKPEPVAQFLTNFAIKNAH